MADCGLELHADLADVAGECELILREQFGAAADRPQPVRRSSQEWFDLLSGFPENRQAVDELRALRDTVSDRWSAGAFERFVILQAILVAAPQVPGLPVDPAVKRLFCVVYRHFAKPRQSWADHFDIDGWRYLEMAQLATLRRFPAGQHDWEITGVPRTWLLKTHPRAVPRLLIALRKLGGFAPLAKLHLDYWRPNAAILLPKESEHSYHRVARSLLHQPAVRGIMISSWFYAPSVGKVTPHLAWMRDFFIERGAYVVEMERAPMDSGFLVGSAKRRQLYEEGRFTPRVALVLWPRRDVLAWAASRPDLLDNPAGK